MMNRYILSILLSLSGYFLFAQDKPELIIQTGHSSTLKAVAYSPDGKYIASGGDDKVVKIWLAASAQELRTFSHTDNITTLTFTADSKFVIAGGGNNELKMWDLEKNVLVRTFIGHGSPYDNIGKSILCARVSPDGKFLLTSALDHTLKLWNIATGDLAQTIFLDKIIQLPGLSGNYANNAASIAFSPDGQYVFAGGVEQTVRMWTTATGGFVKKFGQLDRQILNLAVSPDGKFVATGNFRGVKIWNIETGTEVRSFKTQRSNWTSLAFSPDGKFLVEGGEELRIWDVNTGELVKDCNDYGNNPALAFSPNGKEFAQVRDAAIKIRRVPTGEVLRICEGRTSVLTKVVNAKNGNWVLTAGYDKAVKFWDTETGKLSKILPYPTSCKYITSFDMSIDCKRILIAENGKSVSLLDVETGKKIWDYNQFVTNGLSRGVSSVTFSKDGKKALLGSWVEFFLWDVENNKQLVKYRQGDDLENIDDVAFSPDERFVASAGVNLRTWDIGKGSAYKTSTRNNSEWSQFYKSVRYSADGKFLFAGNSDNTFTVYNTETQDRIFYGREQKALVTCVAVSPDGKYVVSGSVDKTLVLRKSDNYQVVWIAKGHLGDVKSVDFTPDGGKITSVGTDGTLRYWDVATGKEILTSISFSDQINFLDITPDGYYFGSKGAFNQGVCYLKGLKIYSFDQFDLQYNRPDIILQRLGKASPRMVEAYKKAWEKRLKKMGFNPANFEAQRSFNVPEVAFAAGTQTFVQTQQNTHTFTFSASDKLFTLNRLNVFVNGIPFYGVKGKSLVTAKAKSTKQTVSIPLSEGKNVISVSVMNDKGVESLAEKIEVTYTPVTSAKPKLFVVAIGVSEFTDKSMNLSYAAKDANDLASLLSSKTDLYQEIDVQKFTNQQATRDNILLAKAKLMKSGVNDEVIVFVASHGLLDANLDYYIATHNVNFANPSLAGLKYEALESLLDGIPARKKLLLIDACHSGEVDKEEGIATNVELPQTEQGVKARGFKKLTNTNQNVGLSNSFELMKDLFADLRKGTGTVVISSASGKEFAFESSEWTNGVFTYSLLEGLKSGKADLNKDKSVQVSELRDYVSQRVRELTNGQQNPTSRTENLENDFRVW